MRELLGFKLTQRQRKDLDDISEKTGIRERSCRRYEWFIFRYLRMSELFYNWNLHAQNISGLSLFFKKSENLGLVLYFFAQKNMLKFIF